MPIDVAVEEKKQRTKLHIAWNVPAFMDNDLYLCARDFEPTGDLMYSTLWVWSVNAYLTRRLLRAL